MRMLQANFHKSWKQYLMKQLLYGHLLPISKTLHDKQNMQDIAGETRMNS